jgi:predicted O-linked N-acetylglucosamine transferase (SPINDLY family)
VGRAGKSILSNVGLAELVGRDVGHYERIAVELAQDLARLSRLRANLRDRMKRSPLMDQWRFARNVEQAYEAMWKLHASGESPRAIDVVPAKDASPN